MDRCEIDRADAAFIVLRWENKWYNGQVTARLVRQPVCAHSSNTEVNPNGTKKAIAREMYLLWTRNDQRWPDNPFMLYHLQVRDAYLPDFWLHLEMIGSATLADLDRYLRAIWLECCGHLSRFSIGGWSGSEIPKKTRVKRAFEPEAELTHIYDFGTSSETLVKVVGVRKGKPLTHHPIVLMARNNQPEAYCMECKQPASWLCIECLYELDEPGTLCDEHVEDHPNEEVDETNFWLDVNLNGWIDYHDERYVESQLGDESPQCGSCGGCCL